MKCPVCGGDRIKNRADLIPLMHTNGFTGEIVDPGGRVLWFGKESLRVSDQCDSCDEAKIRAFIARRLSDSANARP